MKMTNTKSRDAYDAMPEAKIILGVIGLLLVIFLLAISALACGIERWAVKTMADSDAKKVSPEPVEVRISDLVDIPAPSRRELLKKSDSRYVEEEHVYRVEALVLGFKHEDDGDFHIVLADPENLKVTMVAEMPDPACESYDGGAIHAMRQAFENRFGHATAKYKKLKSPVRVVVTGVGFFDFVHGQTGVAKNGFELHPVLAFYVSGPGAKPVSDDDQATASLPY